MTRPVGGAACLPRDLRGDEFRPPRRSLLASAVRQSSTISFAIRGPILRTDLAGLYGRVCALLTKHAGAVLVCEVRGVAADAVTVDALARLALAARRHGCQIRLRDASEELLELVSFMGLADVLCELSPTSGSR